MEHYLSLYTENPLFEHVGREEVLPLLQCMQAQKRVYGRGDWIFTEGEAAFQLGIILTGRVNTVYEDVFGGRSILDTMKEGQLFCDAFSCSSQQRMPVGVMAQTDADVLLISVERILHTCRKSCESHRQLSENLIHILADKYMAMSRKMMCLSERTTRRKLLSYLSEQQRAAGGAPFPVPFNRQELADFLFVDRTGLSGEWNRLLQQGYLHPAGELWSLTIPPASYFDAPARRSLQNPTEQV
jgi:CRP-like cAMP-binding protein